MDKKLNYNTPELEVINIEISDILLVSDITKTEGVFDWDDNDEIW